MVDLIFVPNAADNHFSRQSRKRFKGYIVAKIGGSQVEKLLLLLIESGAIYSAIWVSVVRYSVRCQTNVDWKQLVHCHSFPSWPIRLRERFGLDIHL